MTTDHRAPLVQPREWDAASYDALPLPHEQWGQRLLATLPLAGDETVLDVGAGTGRDTAALLDRLPRGRVVAVDGSAAMLDRLRSPLGGGGPGRADRAAAQPGRTADRAADPGRAAGWSGRRRVLGGHAALAAGPRGGIPLAGRGGAAGRAASGRVGPRRQL